MIRRVSVEQMRQHILRLCEDINIVIYWVKRPSKAFALHECEEIHIPHIRSQISYATALHEFGHIKGRHQRSRSVMVCERWAWHWARSNALIWTPAMEHNAQKSLAWYAARPKRKLWINGPTVLEQLAAERHRSVRLDQPDARAARSTAATMR